MSEDDKWDSENFRADLPPKSGPIGLIANQWDGEDEEEDVKDSWDDPEEEETDDKKDDDENDESTVKAVQIKKSKKLFAKIEEKEKKLQEELEKKLLRQKELMTPEELQAEKLRQQQLQEEADLEVAKHLFGENVSADVPVSNLPVLNISVLESKEDFEKYKDRIISQIGSATKNQNFPAFVEQLIQALCVHLSATDLKKIHTWVGNLHIEKHRMEQGTKSKKKGKGKAKLKLDDDNDIYSSYNEDVYDDFM